MHLRPMSRICENPPKTWSGKEDSNLRPLPPEDVAPDGMARFSRAVWRTRAAYVRACSRSFLARGLLLTFGPCLWATPAVLCAGLVVAVVLAGVGLGA